MIFTSKQKIWTRISSARLLYTFLLILWTSSPVLSLLITTQALLENSRANLVSVEKTNPVQSQVTPVVTDNSSKKKPDPSLIKSEAPVDNNKVLLNAKIGDVVRRNMNIYQSMYDAYIVTSRKTFNNNTASLSNYVLIPVNDFETYKYKLMNEQLKQKQATTKQGLSNGSSSTNEANGKEIKTNEANKTEDASKKRTSEPTATFQTVPFKPSPAVAEIKNATNSPASPTSIPQLNISELGTMNNDQLQNILANLQNKKVDGPIKTSINPAVPQAPAIQPTASTNLTDQDKMLANLVSGGQNNAALSSKPMNILNSAGTSFPNQNTSVSGQFNMPNSSNMQGMPPQNGNSFPGMSNTNSSFNTNVSMSNSNTSFGGGNSGGGDTNPFARFGPPPRQ